MPGPENILTYLTKIASKLDTLPEHELTAEELELYTRIRNNKYVVIAPLVEFTLLKVAYKLVGYGLIKVSHRQPYGAYQCEFFVINKD